jgi:hypothetical protein
MTDPRHPTCQTCKFFGGKSEYHSSPTGGFVRGACRRRAPLVPFGHHTSQWPIVFHRDWCGEFEEKENP